MSWYLTITPPATQPATVDAARLVGFLQSLAELRHTGPVTFESVPGLPWLALTLAKRGRTAGYASDGSPIAQVDIIELVCADTDDTTWYDALAGRIAGFLGWAAMEEQEGRQVWPAAASSSTGEPALAPPDRRHLHTPHPLKLSAAFSGALRTFSYWVAAGSVGRPLLQGVDYRRVMLAEPSLLERAYAIFVNVIELNAAGEPVNAKYAEHRAAQYIRNYCDPGYVVEPPLEDWEQALHDAPPGQDVKPWSGRAPA